MLSCRVLVVFAACAGILGACGRCGYDAHATDGAPAKDGDSLDAPGDAELGLDDGATVDAFFACPPECNAGCAGNACRIAGDALATIVCPPGIPCVVTCTGFQSCKTDIMCADASSCHVQCIGEDSCYFGIECGSGPCTVDCTGKDACPAVSHCNDAPTCTFNCTGDRSCPFITRCGAGRCNIECTGPNSCRGGIDCAMSCGCDVSCAAIAACPKPPAFVTCPNGCEVSDGCDSTLAGCDTCQ